jgi:hypothetical protein
MEEHYRVRLPGHTTLTKIDEMREWCRKYCSGKVKQKYTRSWDERKKKFTRDRLQNEYVLKFSPAADAMAFKLRWMDPK